MVSKQIGTVTVLLEKAAIPLRLCAVAMFLLMFEALAERLERKNCAKTLSVKMLVRPVT